MKTCRIVGSLKLNSYVMAALALLMGAAAAARPATAATYTWLGGSSGNWATAANWNTGALASNSTVLFTGTALALSTTDNTNLSLAETLSYAAGAASYGIYVNSGNTLAINSLTDSSTAPQTMSGVGTVQVTATNANWNLGAGGTFTCSAAISGTGSLIQTGTGLLTLNGANSYSGTTSISGGTLSLTGSLNSSSVLATSGATFSYADPGTNSQTLNGLHVNSGVSAVNDTVSTDTLALGAITRNVGATVDFTTITGAITTSTANTNGILGGWATTGGTTWAVANGTSSAITGLLSASYSSSTTAGNTAASYASSNIDVTSSPTLSGAITPNSLRFNTAAAETLTLTGANVITTGGILVTSNVANHLSTVTGGTLQGASGKDLVVIQNDASNGLTIASTIADNTTATGLTKSGPGLLSLTGSNTYTGTTIINGGSLSVGNGGSGEYLASQTVVDNGALLFNHGDALTYSGAISGNGSLTKLGGGALTLTGSSTYAGNTTVSNGTLNYFGGASSNVSGVLTVAGAATAPAVLNINTSGVLNFGNVDDEIGYASTAAVNMSSGTLNFGGAGYIKLGEEGGYGSFNLSGGNVISTGDVGLITGEDGNSYGSFVMSGGSLFLNKAFTVGDGGVAAFTITGGSMTSWRYDENALILGSGGTGTFNLGTESRGTGLFNCNTNNPLVFENAGCAFNLNGGTLAMNTVYENITSKTVSGCSFNANGGTILLGASVPSLTDTSAFSFFVYKGGLTVNTGSFSTTMAGNLLQASGSGVYANGGNGTLTIASSAGGSGYIGAPLVSVSGGSGSGALAVADVSSGAVTGVTLTCPGQNYQVGDVLTFSFARGGYGTAANSFTYALTANDLAANTGGLTVAGSGLLTLSGSNSYIGGTTVSAGILDYAVTAAQPASGVTTVANGATLALGVGTGPGYYSSAQVDSLFTNTLPSVSMSTSAGVGIDTTAGNFTYATSNSGSMSLVKVGANTLTLTGTSSYTGATIVNGGTLSVSYLTPGGQPSNIGAASSAASNIVLAIGGMLLYTGPSVAIDRGFTSAGGTISVAAGQTLTTSGAVNVNASSNYGLTVLGNLSLSGSVTLFNPLTNALLLPTGGTLTTSGTVTNPNGNIIFQGGTLNVAGGTLTTSRTVALGNLAGIAGSTLTVSGGLYDQTGGGLWLGQSAPGTLNLNGGMLETAVQFATQTAGVTLNFNGGTLQLAANLTSGLVGTPANTTMNVGNGGAIFDVNGYNTTISNSLLGSGSGGLTLESTAGGGQLTLSGTNTYTGGTTVSGGLLDYATTAAQSSSGTTTVANGATLALGVGTAAAYFSSAQVDSLFTNTMANVSMSTSAGIGLDTTAGNFTYATSNSGSMSLAKLGGNMLTLTGSNTFTGATTISGGTLQISGSGVLGGGNYSAPVNNNAALVFATSASQILSGVVSGSGAVYQLGSGALSLLAANSYTGNTYANAGTLIFSGSAATSTAKLYVGYYGSAAAVIQNAGNFSIGAATNGQDVVALGGGTGGYGFYLMNGGSLTTGQFSLGGDVAGTNLTGVLDVKNGSALTVASGGGWLIWGWNGTSPNGVLNIYNGTVTNNTSNDATMSYANNGAWGALNLLGSGALMSATGGGTTAGVNLAKTTGGTASFLNLNGGVLLTNHVIASVTTTPTYLGFNGGTLRANSTNSTNFISGLTQATIYSSGGTIDTNGYSVTSVNGLLSPTGSGLSSIAVTNSGSGYLGEPAVRITGGGGQGASAIAEVDLTPGDPGYGQIEDIRITSPGYGYSSAPTITLIGGGYSSSASLATPSMGTAAGGGLTVVGSGTLVLAGTDTYSGGTTVSSGILDYSVTAAQPSSGTTTVANGATLALGAGTVAGTFNSAKIDALFANTLANVSMSTSAGVGIDTSAGNFTYATSNSGSQSLVKLGANTLFLTGSNTTGDPARWTVSG